MATVFDHTSLESLEVGAVPVIRRFLERLQFEQLFARHLPTATKRPEDIPTAVTLCILVTNLLLARRPLYALAEWLARRVPEHLGLEVVANSVSWAMQPEHLRWDCGLG